MTTKLLLAFVHWGQLFGNTQAKYVMLNYPPSWFKFYTKMKVV